MKENNFVAFNHYLYNLEVQGDDIKSKWQYLQVSIKNIT